MFKSNIFTGVYKSLATKFCTVAPNICGSSVWTLLHVTILAPRILRYYFYATQGNMQQIMVFRVAW